jgi:hypothetical protein
LNENSGGWVSHFLEQRITEPCTLSSILFLRDKLAPWQSKYANPPCQLAVTPSLVDPATGELHFTRRRRTSTHNSHRWWYDAYSEETVTSTYLCRFTLPIWEHASRAAASACNLECRGWRRGRWGA